MIGFRVNLRQPPEHFIRFPVHEIIGRPLSGWDLVIKAALDFTIATLALLALLPVFIVIAVAIKIDSPGPVFFLQKRLGFNNQIFTIFKFRTMYASPVPTQSTRQATRNDPRVTRVGWFLRRTSLDELPQLLNVLNGTMSLVGPRPHAIDHNEEYAKKIRGYFGRHRVKPGITGLAQVNGFRGETDTVEKMEKRVLFDIHYVDNWNILLDMKIILRTVIIMFGGNAY
jgi:exopolysaccharide biosynthesis polyprenyl glycosylphosphotransferase